MGNRFLKFIFASSAVMCLILYQPIPVRAAAITDIRFWSAPDHTRVVLDLNGPIRYETSSLDSPSQFFLELNDVSLLTKKRELEVNDPFVKRLGFTDLKKGKAKLIFYQKKPLNVSVFQLKPYLDKPHRLVIDLVDVAQEKKDQEERHKQKAARSKGTKIVLIDPGHGGEDPGAIGPRKTMEKDVVLKLGEKMATLLNQTTEIKAFLTRKGDYFVELKERRRIAGEYGADLFISLHADASFNPQAKGSSVYCLSLSGATDEAARILARKENLSNVLGGVTSGPVTDTKDDLNQILLDLTQNNTMRGSLRFAELVLEDLKSINHLKYPTYRQANFIVLREPKFPSVLVETAFITNKEDERLLTQDGFQERLTKALASSVRKFSRELAD